jgi:hypothetical protein
MRQTIVSPSSSESKMKEVAVLYLTKKLLLEIESLGDKERNCE